MNLNRHFIVLASILFAVMASYADEITFITSQEMDLGEVESGLLIKDRIQFVNTGNDPITIARVRTSCGCTVADVQQKNYAPGDTATITFQLNTRGFKGKIHKSITIEFENHDLSSQTVQLYINCLNYLEYNPIYLVFAQIHVNPDTLIEREITMTNHSKEPITIKSINTDLDLLKLHINKKTIEPDETVKLEVELKPLRPERQAYSLTIETDRPESKPILIQTYVNIQE